MEMPRAIPTKSVSHFVAAILLAISGLVAIPSSASSEAPLPRPDELQIRRLYQAVLGRQPEPDGLAYWFAILSTGTPLDRITQGFVDSTEFRTRFGVIPGSAGDEPFVNALYENVLGRTAEQAGYDYWLRELRNGTARYRVVLAFSESPEFVRKTGLSNQPIPAFSAKVSPVTPADLGSSWREGCPVDPDQLRSLKVTHLNFDGGVSTGELVVNARDVGDLETVFRALYEARYPVERMVPVQAYGSDDIASMEDNNTSVFNCRAVTGGTGWSRHAFGVALDINPLVNPYVTSTAVLPAEGAQYVDRTVHHAALIREGDVVVKAFDAIGWRWGGRWSSLKDWHHFDRKP